MRLRNWLYVWPLRCGRCSDRAAEVARLVIGEGLRTTPIGTVAGFALAASRAIAAPLFHATAFDVPTFAAAMLVLLAIAAAASSLRAE